MNAIQQQIKMRMAEKRLSTNELEKQAGLKSSAVGNIIYGRSKNPGIETIQNIARALNCSVSELIEEELSSDANLRNNPVTEIENFPWNSSLYLDCLNVVSNLLKNTNRSIDKNVILNYIEEAYKYSISSEKGKADPHFAKWLIKNNMENI